MPIFTHQADIHQTQNLAVHCCAVATFRCQCAVERAARQSSEIAEALHTLRLVETRRAFSLFTDDDAFDALTNTIHAQRVRLQMLADRAESEVANAAA